MVAIEQESRPTYLLLCTSLSVYAHRETVIVSPN